MSSNPNFSGASPAASRSRPISISLSARSAPGTPSGFSFVSLWNACLRNAILFLILSFSSLAAFSSGVSSLGASIFFFFSSSSSSSSFSFSLSSSSSLLLSSSSSSSSSSFLLPAVAGAFLGAATMTLLGTPVAFFLGCALTGAASLVRRRVRRSSLLPLWLIPRALHSFSSSFLDISLKRMPSSFLVLTPSWDDPDSDAAAAAAVASASRSLWALSAALPPVLCSSSNSASSRSCLSRSSSYFFLAASRRSPRFFFMSFIAACFSARCLFNSLLRSTSMVSFAFAPRPLCLL